MTAAEPDNCQTCTVYGQLTATQHALKETNRLLKSLLRFVSHDLRSAANGILGAGELLITETASPEVAALFSKSSLRFTRLIEDMELLAELEAELNDPGFTGLAEFLEMLPRHAQPAPLPEGLGIHLPPKLLQRVGNTLSAIQPLFNPEASHTALPPPRVRLCGHTLEVDFPLLQLKMPETHRRNFFHLDFTGRAQCPGESLGLSPVVAGLIIQACGGELALQALNPGVGFLHLTLPLTLCP